MTAPRIEALQECRIAPWMANEIWHVLVEECGEPRWFDRSSFVAYLDRDTGGFGHEYRFMGKLGFGGKFYNDGIRWRVGCYPEHETPARRAMIRRANERLTALRQAYITEGA
jgi:hypothetical protein